MAKIFNAVRYKEFIKILNLMKVFTLSNTKHRRWGSHISAGQGTGSLCVSQSGASASLR